MHRFLFAVVVACVLADQAFGAVGTFVLFPNRDSQGGALYGGAPVQTKDEAACRLVCTLDTLCFGYTWVQPSNPTWSGFCYRKGTVSCNAYDLGIVAIGKFSGLIATSCGDVYCNGVKVNTTPGQCATPAPTLAPSQKRARMRRMADLEYKSMRQTQLCPYGTTACYLGSSPMSGYECVDLDEELERCGDCNTDCTAIPGAKSVTCRAGQCVVGQCGPGYDLIPTLTGGECRSASRPGVLTQARHKNARSIGL